MHSTLNASMYPHFSLLAVAALTLAGCAADNDAGSLFTESGAATLGAEETGAEGEAGDDASTSAEDGDPDPDSTDDDGGGIKLDTLPPDTGDDGNNEEEGCSYVDILFVIDNSASMTSYQQALTAAFPTFVEAMFDTLPPNTDLHVGVTTSSMAPAGGSHSEINCEAAESVATMLQYYVPPDQGMIAGNGFQGRLVEYDSKRYFAANTGNPADLGALTQWFTNAAAVGSSGCSFEYNAAAAGQVFNPANAGFNDGFIRDEGAVLMLFILSDESDQSFDVEDPDYLHDLVVDAKQNCGGEACIVTGGLLSSWCQGDQNASYQFLAGFGEEPVWGVINSGPLDPPPDYTQVVGDALAQVIGETCETIPPVG